MQRRVIDALSGLTETPWHGDIRKLEGGLERYRLRVGDWRVIFQPDRERRVVVVVAGAVPKM